MLEQNKERYMFILMIAGISVVVLTALFFLVIIWMPKSDSQSVEVNKVAELGSYKTFSYSYSTIVQNYVKALNVKFFNNDTTNIYSILNKGYIDYFGVTQAGFEKFLKEKNILGNQFTASNFESTNIDGNNVYLVTLISENKTTTQDVIITEYSPKQFSLTFDDFISFDKVTKEYVTDALKLEVINRTYLVSRVDMTVKLTNVSSQDLIINKSKTYENIYLSFDNDTEFVTNTKVLAGETVTLKPGQVMNFTLSFNIPKLYHYFIRKIVVKDVYFTKTGLTKDIEFEI